MQTLRQVLDRLKETYCGTIGYEVRGGFRGWSGRAEASERLVLQTPGRCWEFQHSFRCTRVWAPPVRMHVWKPSNGTAAAPPAVWGCLHAPGRAAYNPAAALTLPLSRAQYMHIPSRDQCNWLRERIETKDPIRYSPDRKVHILDRLAWSEM